MALKRALTELQYVDDLVILVDSEEKAQRMTDAFTQVRMHR